MKTMKTWIAAAITVLVAALPVRAEPGPANWDAVLQEARGQTVYWNAWGGSQQINDFIEWLGDRTLERHGVTVEHVKLSDTAEAVSRVVAEKAAGRDEGGAVDLIWINGENFASMKEQGLLFGPWAEAMPNWQFVDVAGKAALTNDFTVPTEGLEAPWGMAQVVFIHDSARLTDTPGSIPALMDWAIANPGRFTFPQPPDFLGSTFLKQALIELTENTPALQNPVEDADYDALTAPLWAALDRLTPALWRKGRAYPQNGARQIQLIADGEIDIAITFNPNEASNRIAGFELPDTARTFVLEGGTLGNASFVAIPYNANARAGAMVLANFIMSPEAQARMQNPEVWGLGTVLDPGKLSDEDRARFEALELGIATLSPEELGPALPEPHASWTIRLEQDWVARYGVSE